MAKSNFKFVYVPAAQKDFKVLGMGDTRGAHAIAEKAWKEALLARPKTGAKDGLKKTYWYEYFIEYCPVCCRDDTYKIRVYDRPKPQNFNERHHFKEVYDYCDAF